MNGKLRILANDKETWRFPAIRGRVRGSDLAFHFFDAPDDFSRTRLDLLFEGDRMYFHNAQGFFGAVPITLNGVSSLHLAWSHSFAQHRLQSKIVIGAGGQQLCQSHMGGALPTLSCSCGVFGTCAHVIAWCLWRLHAVRASRSAHLKDRTNFYDERDGPAVYLK